jgi:hypothetical protein
MQKRLSKNIGFNRSPGCGFNSHSGLCYYKQVAATRLWLTFCTLLLQTGRRSAALILILCSVSTNSSPLRGFGSPFVLHYFKYFAGTRLWFYLCARFQQAGYRYITLKHFFILLLQAGRLDKALAPSARPDCSTVILFAFSSVGETCYKIQDEGTNHTGHRYAALINILYSVATNSSPLCGFTSIGVA